MHDFVTNQHTFDFLKLATVIKLKSIGESGDILGVI